MMRALTAQKLLGLTSAQARDLDAIKKAATDAIRAAHPDNGGDPHLAADQIKRAKEARDTLIVQIEAECPVGEEQCPACKGRGYHHVRGFSRHDCRRCFGTGFVAISEGAA